MPDRFMNLTNGVAMVVSDLHGDRDAFDRCLAHFHRLFRHGQADRLIFLGDVIHGYGAPAQDASVSMVLDIMALQARMGPDVVVMLLGNHEMPHVYGVSLSKGEREFTPRFEHALGPQREAVIRFFEGLPFGVRTSAGVMLLHAGPSIDVIAQAGMLADFDHRALLDEIDTDLAGRGNILPEVLQGFEATYHAPYDTMAREMLAVDGPHDPRYLHLLRGLLISHRSQHFRALWDLLFTRNELGLNPAAYRNGCQRFLTAFSKGAPVEQNAIVSGHIATPNGGHRVVNLYHLRLASAAHACPREAGEYLLLDCARPVPTVEAVLGGLRPVF